MSLGLKRGLTISIDETDDEEENEELQEEIEVFNEVQNFKSNLTPLSNREIIRKLNERNNLFSKNNSYLNDLLCYMEGENFKNDISYKYIISNRDINSISKSIFISNENYNFEKIIRNRNFEDEFNLIKLITGTSNHKLQEIEISKSLKRNNNRYSDILPYKFNAVPYQFKNLEKNNQNEWYINASYINGPFINDEKCFIAAQAPVKNTISKFYKMLFNNDVKLIIMLCSFEEYGRKKCEYYLPNEINKELILENELIVKIINEEFIIQNCLIKREIVLKLNNEIKTLYHLQILNWKDYSSPDENEGYKTINYLIHYIAESREFFPKSPVLIHCSAGIGRTGTLIAIFNLIKCVSFFKGVNYDKDIKPFISVFNMVRKLREQRRGMVSCWEQYKFIYQFVLLWIQRNFFQSN